MPATTEVSLWVRRVGWFCLIWLVSVLALGIVAYGIRAILR